MLCFPLTGSLRIFFESSFKNYEELSSKILEVYENSTKEKHLEIFNSHPYLALEKILTEDSKKEQNSSKLNQCSKEEFEESKNLLNSDN